jgi:glucosamine--fructose-6-phosphate aminotransferase (isomerizing)
MTNNFINNPYFKDIMAQPDALQATLDGLRKLDGAGGFADQMLSGKLRQVVLTGMGSSFYVLHPLLLTLIERGVTVQMMETAELIHYAPRLIGSQTLLVVVSQSGRSAEILSLLEQNAGDAPIIAVTNTASSPLAEAADVLILTEAGEEHSVSCKTYLTALAALAWLGDALTDGSPQGTLDVLQQAVPQVESYLRGWSAHVSTLMEQLSAIRFLSLVGRGPSLAAAQTGGLIIKESAHFPAEGMSSAAFRHGPLEMVSEEQFVLIYAGLPQTADLNRNLGQDVHKAGGLGAVVDRQAAGGVFALPAVPDGALPLLEILPAQMISLALAQLHGHQAGAFSHAHKVTTVE